MNQVNSLFLLISFFLLTSGAICQNGKLTDEQLVKELIVAMFDGMRAGDSAMVSKLFRRDARMFTAYKKKTGEDVIHEGDLVGFLKAIGSPHDEIWDEKISNTIIQIDGNIAQVWTDYSFFVGENFSHCGVDAFHLVRDNETWKIINLMDTRRNEGCN